MSRQILALIGQGMIYFIYAINLTLIARALLSWFVSPFNRIMQVLVALTEPFVAPIRNLLSRLMGGNMMGLDFSLFVTMLLLSLLRTVVARIFF